MSDNDLSLAEAEALFGPENWERIARAVEAAPPFSQEQQEKFRALFATTRVTRPADSAADAA